VFAGKNPGGGTIENIYQTKKKLARTPNLLELQMNRNDYVTNIKHYKANEKKKKNAMTTESIIMFLRKGTGSNNCFGGGFFYLRSLCGFVTAT